MEYKRTHFEVGKCLHDRVVHRCDVIAPMLTEASGNSLKLVYLIKNVSEGRWPRGISREKLTGWNTLDNSLRLCTLYKLHHVSNIWFQLFLYILHDIVIEPSRKE
jgi:hypothetical protein